jgi:hypothetical protein
MIKTILAGLSLLLVADAAFAGPLLAAVPAALTALGSAGVAAASGLLGSATSALLTKKPPALTPPKAMPTVDDEAAQAARRRQIAEMQARGGRASTILSDDSDAKLGG